MLTRRAVLILLMTGACGAWACPAQSTNPQQTLHASKQRVDINHAPLEDLLKIPGMTRTWTARIVRFRPYRAKNDLLDHGIVSSEVYVRIKDYIVAHRDKR